MIKSLFKYIIGSMTLFSGIASAESVQNFNILQAPFEKSQCIGDYTTKNLYVTKLGTGYTFFDKFIGDKAYLKNENSVISMFLPSDIVLDGCTSALDWTYWSNFHDGHGFTIPYACATSVHSPEGPRTESERTIQFAFDIGYRKVVNKSYKNAVGPISSNNFLAYKSIYDFNISVDKKHASNGSPTKYSMSNLFFSEPRVMDKGCFNMILNYCGDGVLQSDEGEKCDYNDPNHINWGASGCSKVCESKF